ncbi:MAG: radical SAM protein [Planctomycetota bacterium]|nr:radical SAM protein [Planctomycetota bacterium]
MLAPGTKKWRLFRAYASRHPIWCAWQVNYKCNFRCGFCNYWRDPMGELPEQTVEEFAHGSKKLASFGTLMISIAGGEPFLRDDVPEIIRAIAEWHFPFITTNGWFITPELAEELFDSGLWGCSISIDYANPKKQDRRRGMKGGFDQAVRALKYMNESRQHKWQRVNLMCVLLHDNLDEIEDLIKLAAEHNAYFMIQPYSNRKTGSDQFRYIDGRVSPRLLELKKKHSNFLSNPSFLANFDRYLDGGVPNCRAGEAFFNIDSTGDIAICVEERSRPVANLFRDSAEKINRALRDRARNNTCTDCWYNCRGEVESLYKPAGVIKSLPTLLWDHGRARSEHARA